MIKDSNTIINSS